MDAQHLQLIRDTISQGFKNTNEKVDAMAEAFSKHAEKDEAYWKTIDDLKAQGRLIKIIGGSSIGTAFAAWLWHQFGLKLW